MGNLTQGASDYTTTGVPDTKTTLSDGPTGNDGLAEQINGLYLAVPALQALLGNALTLKGSTADLVTRLSRVIGADGALAKGTSFPVSPAPIDGQPFYRTDLDLVYIYDSTTTTWKPGFDNPVFALLDGTRDFTGDIKIKKAIPALRLTGTEGSAKDLLIRENAGVLYFYDNTGTEAVPVWTERVRIDMANGDVRSARDIRSDRNMILLGTGTNIGTLTHANTADRIYTLPNYSGTVLLGTGTSLGVGTADLKTATGSASGSLGASGHVNISMNDFSFAPNIQDTSGANDNLQVWVPSQADDSTTVGRLRLTNVDVVSRAYAVRWRYITASDNPEMWVLYDPSTGIVQASWASDDPLPGGMPGLQSDGLTSLRLTAKDLESFTALSEKASEAQDYIRDRNLKPQHQAYRALQLLTGDTAPSRWIMENCRLDKGVVSVDVTKGASIKENIGGLS